MDGHPAPPKSITLAGHILEAFQDAERLNRAITLRLPKHGIQVSVRFHKGQRQISLRDGSTAQVTNFLARTYANAAGFTRPRIDPPGTWDKKPVWLVTDMPDAFAGPGLPIPVSQVLVPGVLYGFRGHTGWCTVRLDSTRAALGETYHMRDPQGVQEGGREAFKAWLSDQSGPVMKGGHQ